MQSIIYFATSNKHKFREAKQILAEHGIAVKHFSFRYNEMRSDNLEEIARDAVRHAYQKLKRPVFVEDSGLFINALNGFPGTFSAWVLKKIGNSGVLKLMNNQKNRAAHFQSCIAFKDGKRIKIFPGICAGFINKKINGKSGFGYDPIFVPEGYKNTFAESIGLKNKLSHRFKSLLSFSKYLKH